jgi:hypothetical protein
LFHAEQQTPDLATLLVLRLFTGIVVWLFFMTRSVQDFCAVGKPKERYQSKEVFLEQSHATKRERMSSNITRSL